MQQSVFLCPGNIRRTFKENLFNVYKQRTKDIHRVVFEPEDLTEAFKQCYRMNLTRESLFPGFDGLAMSMTYQLWLYKLIGIKRKAERKRTS